MAVWLDRLQASLAESNCPVHRIASGSGELAVTAHAARIVACSLAGVEENLFFHDRGLENPALAPDQLAKAGALIGGDRLWIAPEVAYMWPDLAQSRVDPFGTYDLPAEMDPGQWAVLAEGDGWIELSADMNLVDHRNGARVSLQALRLIAASPLPADWPADLPAIAFTHRHQLNILEGDDQAWVGIWHLLQMPVGGTLICPTTRPTTFPPQDYYSPFRSQDITVTDQAVHFHALGDSIIKMGLPAEAITGRMAYLRPLADGRLSAIVRGFLPQPGAPYIDVPRSFDSTLGGDALQAFCSDQGDAGFTEMEYHEPGLNLASGLRQTHGGCWTLATAGPPRLVSQQIQQLLGVPVG